MANRLSDPTSTAGQSMRDILDDPYKNRYRNVYGDPNFDPDREMSDVETQYNEQFGRQARPEEVAYWQGQNIASDQLGAAIANGAQGQDRTFSRVQQGLLPIGMDSYSSPEQEAMQSQRRMAHQLRKQTKESERGMSRPGRRNAATPDPVQAPQQPAAVDSVRNDLNNAWQQPNVDPMQDRSAATPDPVQAPPEAQVPQQQGGQTGEGYFSGYNYYNPNSNFHSNYPKNPDGTYKSDLMDTQDENYGLNPTNAMQTSTPSDPALYAAGIRAS